MSGTYLFSLWLLYGTENVQDSTVTLITDKFYFFIWLYSSIHHIVVLLGDAHPNNKTLEFLWEIHITHPLLTLLFWTHHSGIKLSCKWRQMISSKLHHHAVDYLYCNIKCVLVNLIDS